MEPLRLGRRGFAVSGVGGLPHLDRFFGIPSLQSCTAAINWPPKDPLKAAHRRQLILGIMVVISHVWITGIPFLLRLILAAAWAILLFVPADLPALRGHEGANESWRGIAGFVSESFLPAERIYVSPTY